MNVMVDDQQQRRSGAWSTLQGAPPVVIAHRGASGHRPEHTLAAYALAIELGADFIEPDLVATADGHLIARHEPLLDDTTDVASLPRFAARRSRKCLDGREVEGFFASDFTLAEIQELRAVQPNAARSRQYDGQWQIPTLTQILQLLEQHRTATGRRVGLYPELKHPSFHLQLDLALEDRLLEALARHDLLADAPVFIQSFESANLQYLQQRTVLPLVQLLEAGWLQFDADGQRVTGVAIPDQGDPRGTQRPHSLADIAGYAAAIGPGKRQILRETAGGLQPTTLVTQAHAAGLLVHTYTFRNEPATLAPQYADDPRREYEQFYGLGVDGVFSDFPDTALAVRASMGR